MEWKHIQHIRHIRKDNLFSMLNQPVFSFQKGNNGKVLSEPYA